MSDAKTRAVSAISVTGILLVAARALAAARAAHSRHPTEAAVVAERVAHAHACDACATRWTHGPESRGSAADHSCPSCGRVQWWRVGERG